MNAKQKNKQSRNLTLDAILRTATETAEVPGFDKAMARWMAANAKLRDCAATQALPLSGAVIVRDEAFQTMQQETLTLAGRVLHYASDKQLPVLASQVRVYPSAFRALRPEQRIQLAEMIHRVVEPVLDQLAEYGVTAAEMEAHRVAIAAAAQAVSAPREALVNRRAATAELREAFRAVDAVIVNHFAPLLLPLKATHPEFYARFAAALEIVNRRGRRAGEAWAVEAPALPFAVDATNASAPVPIAKAA